MSQTLRSASGATTVPMSRPSATQSPSAMTSRCLAHERRADGGVGGAARGLLADLGAADAVLDVAAVEEDAPLVVEAHVDLRGVAVAGQRDGAVHRPRVEEAEAERARGGARHGRLAGPGGTVDRDEHARATIDGPAGRTAVRPGPADQGRASSTMFVSVSAARRTEAKPPWRMTSVSRASPACVPRPIRPGCASEPGVQTSVEKP